MHTAPFTPGPPYDPRNIAEARRLGIIVGDSTDTSAFSIDWSGFSQVNTRKLCPLGLQLFRFVKKNGSVFISGHGAGGETSNVYHLRPDLQIYSAGFSPIDPYYPFINTACEADGDYHTNVVSDLQKLGIFVENIKPHDHVCMQNTHQMFVPVNIPYIKKQFGVDSLLQVALPINSIDLVYDYLGYFYYEADVFAIRQKIIDLLSDSGIAYIPSCECILEVVQLLQPEDIFINLRHSHLIVKARSQIADILRPEFGCVADGHKHFVFDEFAVLQRLKKSTPNV